MSSKQRFAIFSIVIIILAIGGYAFFQWQKNEESSNSGASVQEQENMQKNTNTQTDTVSPFEIVAGTYVIEPGRSTLTWKGKNLLISHEGTVAIKEGGAITADEVSFLRGEFVIDMTTIQENLGSQRLDDHLKSDDFFSVNSYPESRFVYTGMQRIGENTALISGNLTLKGQTHTITFPAYVENIQDGYHLQSAFEIDRTRWDVRYGSGKFFQNLGDKTIDDTIVFELDGYFKNAGVLNIETK